MNRRFLFLTLFTVFYSSLCHITCLPIFADTQLEIRSEIHAKTEAEKPKTLLRVGTTGDYPPFSHTINQHNYTGIDIQLIRQFANDQGYRLQFIPTSWAQWVEDLTLNRFDIAVGGISVTHTRKKRVQFAHPIHHDGKKPIAHCSQIQQFDSLREINRSTVVLLFNAGGTNETFANKKLKKAQHKVIRDNRNLFKALLSHQGDVIVTDGIEAEYQANQNPSLCTGKKPFTKSKKAFALQKSNKHLLKELNKWIEKQPKTKLFIQSTFVRPRKEPVSSPI